MLAAVNTKLLIAILAVLALVGTVLVRIEANTRRTAQAAQQPIDENARFAHEVERLKAQQKAKR